MNKKMEQYYEQLAQSTGLRFDAESGALYGQQGGFDLVVSAQNESTPRSLMVSVSAQRPENLLAKEEVDQFKKDNKMVQGLVQNGNVLTMSLKNTINQNKLQGNLSDALQALVHFLSTGGFQNCCQACGKTGETNPCYFSGRYLHLCSDCFTALQKNETMNQERKKSKNENLIGGMAGALIGSLLGVACILILKQLGYVASISGVVMAFCTLKGYELLGGKLTKKGIIISIVLMLVMTFIGDWVDWAILITREVGTDFVTAFRVFPMFLQNQMIESTVYWGNLVLLYVFLLIGAVPTISTSLKNKENEGRIYCLGKNTPQL